MVRQRTCKTCMRSAFVRFIAALVVLTAFAGSAIAQNPVPFIDQPLVPDAAAPGGAGFTLTVNGGGFVAGSVVNWNGSPRATAFVSNHKLTAAIPATDIANASTASVTVVSPSPGGGASNTQYFSIAVSQTPLSFLPAVTYQSGGANPLSVVVADLNGDGKPDLVVANQCTGPNYCGSPGLVSVLLGVGDGTFQPAVNYGSGGSVLNSVVVADVNGDGKPDIIAVNECSTADFNGCLEASIGVLLGNGDGTFNAVVTYTSGGYRSKEVAVADLNGDGKVDLVVVNLCATGCDDIFPAEGTVAVLLGEGDGTFQKPVTYPSGGFYSFSIAVADLNGDGRADVVVSNFCDSNVSVISCDNPAPIGVLMGNGDGTLQPAVLYGTGGMDTRKLVVADVNGDGKPDLVAGDCGPGGCGGADLDGVVAVLLGRGDGTFQSAITSGSGLGSYVSIDAADVDGDGKPDIVAANWTCGNSETSCADLFRGNGDGTFQSPEAYDSGSGNGSLLDSLAVADVNGDGRLDIVATHGFGNGPSSPGSVDILLNSTGSSQASTTAALASLPNPSVFGREVTVTATVSSTSGTPTGTVVFYNGSTAIGSGTLTGGKTSIAVSSLPVGSDSITAVYEGSVTFASSTSSPLIQTVSLATTSTGLTSSLNPSSTGQSVTFSAAVTSQFGGVATGSVTFYSGSQTLGTASLSGNRASLTTSFATSGTYSISAKYNGDGNNRGSTSSTLSQVIITATTTKLTSSLNPSLAGQAVTFAATVSSTAGAPPNGETVTFHNGSAVLGTASLSGGIASLTTSSLPVGIFTITATYAGDAKFAASTSLGLRQVVNSTD